ncbi:MAG: helix-turn-helix domain-containing protein [Aquihabitans sp.]
MALDLFERQGFEQTTVAQIAEATGVSEMTFFRHFAVKHGVLFDDPYDDIIVGAVRDQPLDSPPLARAVAGFRQAWRWVPEPETDLVRRRTRIVAMTPSLRGEMWQTNAVAEALIADQLIDDGTDPVQAKVAASAVLAALTAALLEWSLHDETHLGDHIEMALDVLEGRRG